MSINLNYIYKLLNATIGSNFEALLAGKTPKNKPIDPEINIVDKVVVTPTEAGRGVITPNIKTPDKKGRIENHRRSDDSFIECANNEYQKMEEKRLRKDGKEFFSRA